MCYMPHNQSAILVINISIRYKNGKRMVKEKRIKRKVNADEELASLEITESKLSDAGTYKMLVTNKLGSVDCSCVVTVHCKYNEDAILLSCKHEE